MFRQKVTPVSKILEGKSKKLFNLEKNVLTSGVLAKGLDIDSKAINSEIGKKLIGKGMKHTPELYKYGKSKIKNKTLKTALESM